MNSIWNKNCALFKKRFPSLAAILSSSLADFEASGVQKSALPIVVTEAKNKSPTAALMLDQKEIALHSKYNPEREAEQLIAAYPPSCKGAVFFGAGLGYAPVAFAKKHPEAPIILIEPTKEILFTAFFYVDWECVLLHNSVIFAIDATRDEAFQLLAQYKASSLHIFSSKAELLANNDYFAALEEKIRNNAQKEEINTNTQEKFAHLWLTNTCKNLSLLPALDGVQKYFLQNGASAPELPFVILAAGPSLETVLPHLSELKKRCILICVDTALHALLRYGVEPDFIVLVDPQYVCALHLEFLRAPSSVLITESAAWPAVFRFECKETVLCSSLFPIGKYFEARLGKKGDLGAGGSVTTTAWDFARKCGAKKIYIAGMDLGFPKKQTHIRGSQFEERAHRCSVRTKPAETESTTTLFTAHPSFQTDYEGRPLLTDKRMSLFSWWFETSCATAQKDGQETYTLTKESLAIKGIQVASLEALLKEPCRLQERETFFAAAHQNAQTLQEKNSAQKKFNECLKDFLHTLDTLLSLSKTGVRLCNKALQDSFLSAELASRLEKIDKEILTSKAKEAAALVFPTERQLEKKAALIPESHLKPVLYSRLIYEEISKAVKEYQAALKKKSHRSN